jgi:hypothetical protein
MRPIRNGIVLTLAVFGLAACGSNEPAGSGSFEPEQMKAAAAKPAVSKEMSRPAPPPPAPAVIAYEHRATHRATRHPVRPASHRPAAATPAKDETASQVQRLDTYLDNLKTAAYTFNPPSPIEVAKPVTVYLWLDPQATAAELAEAFRQAVPRDAGRVESGETSWSPKMRATLSGPDFEIKAIDPEEQLVGSTQRTTWSWDITPLRAGEKLALHLRLAAVLPEELGPPKTITTLEREINVEVTWWWLFDHYFDKYWKWLLGGLGTALASAIAWWWKNRKGGATQST